MGNRMSLGRSDGSAKIVYWDGWVQEFEKAVTVAELMLEHPQQVVVEFHSAVNQKRPIPLPADKTLERNKVYLMLPMKLGKPLRFNSKETRRILLVLNSLHSKSLLFPSTFLSRLARICHQRPPIGIGEGVVKQKKQEIMEETEERYNCSQFFPEFSEGTPEYFSRQLSGRGWKPSLDTIKEKKIERNFSGTACLPLSKAFLV